MPTLSHIVYGTVKDIYGTALSGATVSLKHTLQDQTLQADELTDSNGTYRVNLAKLDSQWSKGEEIQVTASKSAEGTKTEITTIQGTGNQVVNITLTETSDLTYYENARDVYTLNFAALTHYDGEKVTRERPFPVQTENPLDKYRASDTKIDGDVRYYGFIDRFGNWYVRRDDLSDTNNRTYRYTKGTTGYPTTLTAMKALSYDFFHNIF